jgi:uncharacterized membrane protein YphA (DoxX/SURF4 family)
MNIGLWVVQALLALVFIGVGGIKVFAYEKYKAATEKKGPSDITRGLARFIGITEMAGGVGLILPVAVKVAPWLTAWAALGLATIMLLAIVYHLRHRESAVLPLVLFLLATFVTIGRFSHSS